MCWAEEGWYDFCSIPYAAKMPMSLPDEDAIRQIPQHYEGTSTVPYSGKIWQGLSFGGLVNCKTSAKFNFANNKA